jgi:hypothetical protein
MRAYKNLRQVDEDLPKTLEDVRALTYEDWSVLAVARNILKEMFQEVDLHQIRPMFGPGSTAEGKMTSYEKYDILFVIASCLSTVKAVLIQRLTGTAHRFIVLLYKLVICHVHYLTETELTQLSRIECPFYDSCKKMHADLDQSICSQMNSCGCSKDSD